MNKKTSLIHSVILKKVTRTLFILSCTSFIYHEVVIQSYFNTGKLKSFRSETIGKVLKSEIKNIASFVLVSNGIFTLHGTGSRTGNGTENNGLLFIMQNVHTSPELGMGPDPLSPIVSGPSPFPCSVNVP